MKRIKVRMITTLISVAISIVILGSCGDEFEDASLIKTSRFLAIISDPLESAPGETINFYAVATNKDGALYKGPVAWSVIGGDDLRLGGETDVESEYTGFAPSSDAPFAFKIPDKEKLIRDFGGWEKNGLLLTVSAAIFLNGPTSPPTEIAFKLFVVSERDAALRMKNPRIEKLEIIEPSGNIIQENQNHVYVTDGNRLTLRAVPIESSDRFSFHWFSTDDDFTPDLESSQLFKPNAVGKYSLYCVLRKTYFFEHDSNANTRITGIDWKRAELRFK